MRQILLFIFTFCTLLLAGCRTTKSAETLKADAAKRWAAQEQLTATRVYDSLYKALVLSADSVVMEWSVPDDTVARAARTRLRAYKVNVEASQEASTALLVDSTSKTITKETKLKEKTQSKHSESPPATTWLLLAIVAGAWVVYSLRKRYFIKIR